MRRQKRKPVQPLEAVDPESGEEIENAAWLVDDQGLPEEKVAQRELEQVIQRCIERLPEDFRSIVLLVDVSGMDYSEASHVVKVPLGTVRSRLARARLRLQDCLQAAWELLPEKYRLNPESRS